MYIIIELSLFNFVTLPETGKIMIWDSRDEAYLYGKNEMQVGLYQVEEIPQNAISNIPD